MAKGNQPDDQHGTTLCNMFTLKYGEKVFKKPL